MAGFQHFPNIPIIHINDGAPEFTGHGSAWTTFQSEPNSRPFIVDAEDGSGAEFHGQGLTAHVSVQRFLEDRIHYVPGSYVGQAKAPYPSADLRFNSFQELGQALPNLESTQRHSSPEGSNWSSSSSGYSSQPFTDSSQSPYYCPIPYHPGSPSEASSCGLAAGYTEMSQHNYSREAPYGSAGFVSMREVQANPPEHEYLPQVSGYEHDADAPGDTDAEGEPYDETDDSYFTIKGSQLMPPISGDRVSPLGDVIAVAPPQPTASTSRYPRRAGLRQQPSQLAGAKRSRSSDGSEDQPRRRPQRKGRPSPNKGDRGRGNNINNTREGRFLCPLAPYSCRSKFSTKNEWKRHMTAQHIRPFFWRCELCEVNNKALPGTVASSSTSTPQSLSTIAVQDASNVVHNDFNRKDLFTQHLRRMHNVDPDHWDQDRYRKRRRSSAAAASSPLVSSDNHRRYPPPVDAADVPLEDLQKRCIVYVRSPPTSSACIYCADTFEGPGSWEKRMDHIGEHIERGIFDEGQRGDNVAEWREDVQFREWLEREELIIWNDNKGLWEVGEGKHC